MGGLQLVFEQDHRIGDTKYFSVAVLPIHCHIMLTHRCPIQESYRKSTLPPMAQIVELLAPTTDTFLFLVYN